jgi:two-component system sensor histidine kinase SenX3
MTSQPDIQPQPGDGPDLWEGADERSLLALARCLAGALERVSEGIIVCDEGGALVFRNTAARHLGAAREGDVLADAAIQSSLAEALRGRNRRDTLELYTPAPHTLAINAFPLCGPDGELLGAAALVEDVSAQRRLEVMRRDFVANVSHELKTPIGALSLLAETLDGEEDAEVASRLTERLASEAYRLSSIIDDLLDLSRIETTDTPEQSPEVISSLVDEAVAASRPAARSRSIDLVAGPIEPGLSVLGTRQDLVSAISNLVSNAVKYSEPGGSVQVRSWSDDLWAYISVTDNGIGIPAGEQERIFERFYRVDRARSRSTGGTGLGLSIVRHVAANHGGEISLESREGEGSTFTLKLPAAHKENPVA